MVNRTSGGPSSKLRRAPRRRRRRNKDAGQARRRELTFLYCAKEKGRNRVELSAVVHADTDPPTAHRVAMEADWLRASTVPPRRSSPPKRSTLLSPKRRGSTCGRQGEE